MPGWKTSIVECKTFESLPQNAKDYITKIEDFLHIPGKHIFVVSLCTKMNFDRILLSILSAIFTHFYSRMDWCWPSTRRCYYQNVIGKTLALGS